MEGIRRLSAPGRVPGISRAAYVGRFGWISVTIASEADLEFTKNLIANSYALIAPKKRRVAVKKARKDS